MDRPIINPSSLTEEQREAIKELYKEFKLQSEGNLRFDKIAGSAKRSALHILFGSDFSKENDMAYLAVDEDGTELRFTNKPCRHGRIWVQIPDGEELPDGTIEKMIGRPLTWEDEPVKIE